MRKWMKVLSVSIALAMLLSITSAIKTGEVLAIDENTNLKLKDAVVLYIGSAQALLNNIETQIDLSNPEVQPFVMNERTLIPVRFLSESFGAKVEWNEGEQSARISLGQTMVEITIGSTAMKVNNTTKTLDASAQLIENRTFVPLRAVVEALGKKVFYDRGLIVVSDKENLFDSAKDQSELDQMISRVNNLPVLGSFNTLQTLLAQIETSGYAAAGRMDNAKTASVMESMAPMAQAVQQASADKVKSAEYSTTNVQVEGVDEADIVKTDGEYIYQVNKERIVITKAYPAETMKISSIIDFGGKTFSPQEMYIDKTKMIVIGTTYLESSYVKAIVYDIENKESIVAIREIEVAGTYVDSRKIGDDVYITSNKGINYYEIKNGKEGNRPSYRDTVVGNGLIEIEYSDIRYFPRIAEPNYITIAAFSLDKPNKKVSLFTYLGAGQNIYASQNSLYIAVAQQNSDGIRPEPFIDNRMMMPPRPGILPMGQRNTLIYKFSMLEGQVTFLHKGEVPGTVLNQFSMDENNGFFRIATTKGAVWGTGENMSQNNLYVLDETMNLRGKIENMAPGEKIYSARFMGDRAYIVTFKTVDPLFVIDLKDPSNPMILGALKIPGYSDYLHPYDENHIIGFGKDTVTISRTDQNGNQKDTNAYYQGMKIALFDVSDVKNPKQEHAVNIGDRGTDSELLRNHKALLFSKSKNLLAFPVTLMEVNKNSNYEGKIPEILQYGEFAYQGAYVYSIEKDKGFVFKGRITHISADEYNKSGSYGGNQDDYISRILYSHDVLYTLSNGWIKANNLNDLWEINRIQIP